MPPARRRAGQAWAEKIGSGATVAVRGGGHGTTPARPNADGGIDFSSRTAQVAGAFPLRGTRPATRSATGRAGALALAIASAGGCHCDLGLGSGIGLPGHKTCSPAAPSEVANLEERMRKYTRRRRQANAFDLRYAEDVEASGERLGTLRTRAGRRPLQCHRCQDRPASRA
jgi:hypothetical protein